MTPTPQERASQVEPLQRPSPGEEVVISGMSGIFPASDSISEFNDNLYNKVDMVSTEDPRWVFNHPEVPIHLGKVSSLNKFDAQFFRVHYKQACTMEPMSRKLLEHAYSAIYDAGINPLQLQGKKVGVFIGATTSESEKNVIYENVQQSGSGITGCNKAMYANRISYWIDGKGPSYCLDLACASSAACLEHAYRSINSGQCEAALVGGSNLCMHPNVSLHWKRAGFLCLDGKTRCFDKNANGHVRSDAINILFLQKAKDAKRIYSEVYHAKAFFSPGSNPLLPIRDPKELSQALETFYSEIGLSPEVVQYVEAHGSAIPEADINELKTIAAVFAKKNPIKVGCVKSNMGSSEPASGACGLTKVCLAYHNRKLPGNLHYNDPLDIPEVQDKVQILTDNVRFDGGFTALNSFSYAGANIHVLLKGYKHKVQNQYKSSIPYLVLASGRQESCVEKILNTLKESPINPEQIGLIHNIHKHDIPSHLSRGYSLLDTNNKNETISLAQSAEYCPGTVRPVWFVYSGMGSQWATMGAELMRIPIFASAIHKCHQVLEPKGVDIVKILTDPDKTIYDNILHSFVGIAAVQIGLTDILKEIGVVPDYIIGHSVGELGCAYADGCFTAEEMVLSAYSRGLVSVQTPFIRGSMAAVGLGYETVLPMCPPEIEVACHNSSESSTISGPADIMKQFVTELTSKGIFAKEVPCSNIAYHSRYIAQAGPGLLEYLSEVIKNPKARSQKWVSTSVPQDKWDEPLAKYSSAEYHTNNLLNPVLFEETSKLIPSNALVIEIAPHGLLQAILKRSLADCVHIPLTRRGTSDPVRFLLESFGKLYQAGLNLTVDVLYPKIKYPVSTGTPFLSHYVQWEHSEDWPEAKYNNKSRVVTTIRDFVMSIHDDDYKYFKGYVRDGNYVYPESAFLVLIWQTLAMYKGIANFTDMSVVFDNVKFHEETIITPELLVRLQIMIFKGSEKFEITYKDSTIVSGHVSVLDPKNKINRQLKQEEVTLDKVIINHKDIYKVMRLRGYNFKDEFQSIHSSTSSRNKAYVKWTDNWITYLDSLIQLNAFAIDFNGIHVPSFIKKLTIDVENHRETKIIVVDNLSCLDAEVYDIYDHVRSGGVEIDGLVFKNKPIVEQTPNVILTQTFVPHFLTGVVSMKTALQVNLQIITENVNDKRVNIANLLSTNGDEIKKVITEVTNDLQSQKFHVLSDNKNNITTDEKSIVVIIDNILGDKNKMHEIFRTLPNNSFILDLEQDKTVIDSHDNQFSTITAMTIEKHILLLLRKVDITPNENITYMPIVHDQKFSWIPRLQMELEKSRKLVLVSERQYYCGLLGLVKKLRIKHGDKIGLIIIDDFSAPCFNPEKDIFRDQLEKKLAFNVLKKGLWGGYYNISTKSINRSENLSVICKVPGNLDSLSWIEKPLLPKTNNLVQVFYSGVSARDVEFAAGKTNLTKHAFGMDFSGINNRGERVMGVVSGGAIASSVVADPELLWPVPAHWTLEDAATVPLAYTQAYYCLAIRSTISKGASVLINGGAGELTQAIINICLSLDCFIYISGCDAMQKEFLLKMFPDLQADNIGRTPISISSKISTDNENNSNHWKSAGKADKCDFVINTLNGAMRREAMDCVGLESYFLDASQNDMMQNEDFGMGFLRLSTHYISINFDTILSSKYCEEKKLLQHCVAEGIARGVVTPLSRVTYRADYVTRALRLLAADKNRGKVLLRMDDFNSELSNVTTRMSYCLKGSYIIVSNERALSIELVDRLVAGGARNLLIHMRPNSVAGYWYTKFSSWNKLNVSLQISSENLQTENGCMNLFKEGAKLGPIRGIFIVHKFSGESSGLDAVGASFNNTVVANLDLTSRNVCSNLQHFVVLNYSSTGIADEYVSSVIDKICRARKDVCLPALVLRAGPVGELSDSDSSQNTLQPQSFSSVLSTLETSMKQNLSDVITYKVKTNHVVHFFGSISRIIGVKTIHELDGDLSLEDLLLKEVRLEEINTAIKNAYRMSFTTEKLSRMTIAELKNLGSDLLKTASTEDCGLGAFISYIDRDECAAAEPIVAMSTSYSSILEEEELDSKATYVMLVPGFEGHHHIFADISERLKAQALTLQLMPDMPNDSIPQIAADISKFVKNRVNLQSKFYLLGYSFGVNVAFELARIFEKQGHVGVVYCLDSSPDALRAQLDAHIGTLSDSELQDAIVEHMYRLMYGRDSAELKQELETKHTWNDKVELCVMKLRGIVKYSHQYKRCLLNGAYKKILLARQYEPDFKLESELVLVKGIPHPNMAKLADDYNLSKYTTKPVKVFDIDSEHALAPQNHRVPNIMNRLFEQKLLEKFKTKNVLCTYFADPIKVW